MNDALNSSRALASRITDAVVQSLNTLGFDVPDAVRSRLYFTVVEEARQMIVAERRDQLQDCVNDLREAASQLGDPARRTLINRAARWVLTARHRRHQLQLVQDEEAGHGS